MANDGPDTIKGIPTLTDPVVPGRKRTPAPAATAVLPEVLRAEIETLVAARVHELSEALVQEAVQRVEAALVETIAQRLREQLPELVSEVLDEVLELDGEDPPV